MIKEFTLHEINNSEVYPNGREFTNNWGKAKIIGRVSNYNGKDTNRHYQVQFIDPYEYKSIVRTDALNSGQIYNPYFPSLEKVGFMGEGEYEATDHKGKHTKNYVLFKGMMARCYNKEYHKRNPSYIECEADVRWHCFQDFCMDIPLLPNYDLWKTLNNYELDKDIKVKGNKIYSKDTCMFVTREENNKAGNKSHPKPSTGLTYEATRIIDGYTEIFTNQAEFSDTYNLSRSKVNCCIKGTRKTHKGWKFIVIKDKEA